MVKLASELAYLLAEGGLLNNEFLELAFDALLLTVVVGLPISELYLLLLYHFVDLLKELLFLIGLELLEERALDLAHLMLMLRLYGCDLSLNLLHAVSELKELLLVLMVFVLER